MVTSISYTPVGTVPDTPDVSFEYDAAGNRTLMTDGFGSKSYSYNQLSQLMSETRTFNGVGTFTLSYDYNLAGELKKITDATNMTINYGYDPAGRLNSVTGSDNLFMNVSNYALNFQYRAWDGLKARTDGHGRTSSLVYNSKLQPTHFEISGGVVSQNYDYYNDGRISYVHNTTDVNFDRSYSYDHKARLTLATTGGTARGDSAGTPYHETFGYDAFSNLTGRESTTWSQDPLFDLATYSDDRRGGWGYDPDGRNTTVGTRTYKYDANGQMTLMTGQKWLINHYVNISHAMGYDGDGDKVQEVLGGQATYYLRSSVLDDAIIAEMNSGGQKNVGYVYSPDGELLARQVPAGSSSYIAWKHGTPTGQYDYNVGGAFGSGVASRVELDPLGADIGLTAPQIPDTGGGQGAIGGGHSGGIMDSRWSNFFDLSSGCTKSGVAASCSGAMAQTNMDGAMRGFFGDGWYDLPGKNDERARAEGAYERGLWLVRYLLSKQAQKTKPKKPTKPPKLKPPKKKTKAEIEKAKQQNAGVGKDETEEHGLTVYLAQPDQRGGSYLNPCAMHIFQELGFGRFVNLNEVRVHMGIPKALDKLAAITAGAMTVDNDIYYRSASDYNPTTVDGLAAVGHELMHVMQQRIMGVGAFTTKYVGEYLANRAKGMSPQKAYENISFEKAAYKVQELLRERIRQQFGDDPCKQFRY